MGASMSVMWVNTCHITVTSARGEFRPLSGESPRTTRVKEIIMAQGLRLLCEDGMAAVTAVRISDATGVARTTIYRHYPEPGSLLLAVVECAVRPRRCRRGHGRHRARPPDCPHSVCVPACAPGRSAWCSRRFLSRRTGMQRLHKAQRRLVDGVLQPVRAVLDEGPRGWNGSQRPVDLDHAVLGLAGPLLTQHVMLRVPIEDSLIERVVQQFMASAG